MVRVRGRDMKDGEGWLMRRVVDNEIRMLEG